MKKILLTAAGTATTWHFCNIIKKYFSKDFEIHLTDINDEKYVPASIFCKKFHKVPGIFEENYQKVMFEILKKEKIDIIIPLIDFDLLTFSSDNKKIKELNVISTAPLKETTKLLADKENMTKFLQKNNIPTPKLFNVDDIEDEEEYIVKPKKGFGSNGVYKDKGKNIKKNYNEEMLIQEMCYPEEITAEIYNGNKLKIFQRKRVATKAGVCTKMSPVNYKQIDESIKKLVNLVECPRAFCIQFMKNKSGDWCIIDCNLRIGAGTALSTKIGFQLVRALLSDLNGTEPDDTLFKVNSNIKSVLRVYEEIAIE